MTASTNVGAALPDAHQALLKSIWRLNRVHNSNDMDFVCDQLTKFCASKLRGDVIVHSFNPGEVHNQWIIPPRWTLQSFRLIAPDGSVVATEADHPLVVGCYSISVDTTLSLAELKHRTTSRADLPEAYSFSFRRMYRHWERDWSISLPHKLLSELPDGQYRLKIETNLSNEPMRVFEYISNGSGPKCIYLAGHLDHPGMINDSLSGCLAGLQVIEALESEHSTLRNTYRIILAPEIIGTAVYLKTKEYQIKDALFSLHANMTSHDAPMAMCRSKHSDSLLDRALRIALRESEAPHTEGAFHAYPDCGDEVSFDCIGYNIPSPTLSRTGERFRNYHTSLDSLSAFLAPEAQARHQQVVSVLTRAIELIELNFELETSIRGNPCLSNPSLDLYLNPSNLNNVRVEANMLRNLDGNLVDLRNFMEFFLDALGVPGVSVLDIASDARLPFDFVRDYAQRFVEKGLATRRPCNRQFGLPSVATSSLHPAAIT